MTCLNQIAAELIGQMAVIRRVDQQNIGQLSHLNRADFIRHANRIRGVNRAGIERLGRAADVDSGRQSPSPAAAMGRARSRDCMSVASASAAPASISARASANWLLPKLKLTAGRTTPTVSDMRQLLDFVGAGHVEMIDADRAQIRRHPLPPPRLVNSSTCAFDLHPVRDARFQHAPRLLQVESVLLAEHVDEERHAARRKMRLRRTTPPPPGSVSRSPAGCSRRCALRTPAGWRARPETSGSGRSAATHPAVQSRAAS